MSLARLYSLYRFVVSAALGLSVVIVTQFLQLDTPLEFPLNKSIYCFAVAIPILATYLFLQEVGAVFRKEVSGKQQAEAEENREAGKLPTGSLFGRVVSLTIGSLAFFYGIAMVFAYFSLAVSILFVALTIVGITIYG